MDTRRPAIDQNPLNAVDMVEHDDAANEVGDFDAQALEMVLLDLLAVGDFEKMVLHSVELEYYADAPKGFVNEFHYYSIGYCFYDIYRPVYRAWSSFQLWMLVLVLISII